MQSRATLTRRSAIENARLTYETLVARALRRSSADPQFVLAVAEAWDERLASLAVTSRFDTTLPDHAQRRFEFLTGAVNVALDDDALFRWLDAFPEAMSELIPPSASTFRVMHPVARTSNQTRLIRTAPAA